MTLHETRRPIAPFLYAAVSVLALGAVAVLPVRTEEGLALLDGKVPAEFVLFGLTLLGVALFHARALAVAAGGLGAILLYKVLFVPSFHPGDHLLHEWRIVVNLLGLLVGFAILAGHFEHSGMPRWIPRILPDRPPWGGIVLLFYVWAMSAFLDNIAAAMIGGVIARAVYRGRVTVAFVAAIVAASNAGGAWSVLGDTTTTMMWIAGKPAAEVFPAIVASAACFLVLAPLAARRQESHAPMAADPPAERVHVSGRRLGVVGLMLAGAVAANVLLDFPAAGVWAALLLGIPLARPDWGEVPGAIRGAAFLVSLVLCASMMPVKALPPASTGTALGLGFVSAVFDNIPLTKLALDQGGHDWALLAYAVGVGGSLTWFGSSAGVAISKDHPEARDLVRWIREGWFVPVAFVAGFLVQVLVG